MSLAAITWAWKQACPTASAKLVLLRLADYADETGLAWSSFDHMAETCQLARRTVINSILSLEAVGIIRRRPSFVDGRQRPNSYLLPVNESRGAESAPLTDRGVHLLHPGGCNGCTPGGAPAAPNPGVGSGSKIQLSPRAGEEATTTTDPDQPEPSPEARAADTLRAGHSQFRAIPREAIVVAIRSEAPQPDHIEEAVTSILIDHPADQHIVRPPLQVLRGYLRGSRTKAEQGNRSGTRYSPIDLNATLDNPHEAIG